MYSDNAMKSHFAGEETEAQWDSIVCQVVSAGFKAYILSATLHYLFMFWMVT